MFLGLSDFSDELNETIKNVRTHFEDTIKRGLINAEIQKTYIKRNNSNEKISQHHSNGNNAVTTAINETPNGDDNKDITSSSSSPSSPLFFNKTLVHLHNQELNSISTPATPTPFNIEHVSFRVDENTNVSLKNIHLLSMLDMRVTHLNADMKTMSMPVEINLGTVRLKSHYEATNEALARLLPVSTEGQLMVTMENMKTRGIIGLHIHGDYFVPTFYDPKYTMQEINIRVEYPTTTTTAGIGGVGGGGGTHSVVSEITSNDIQNTIVRVFWKQLVCLFNNAITQQFEDVLKEISITELLPNEQTSDVDIVNELRMYSMNITTIANNIIDAILNETRSIVAKHITTANTSTYFSRKSLRGRCQQWGAFQTSRGLLTNINQLQRKCNSCVTNKNIPLDVINNNNNNIVTNGTNGKRKTVNYSVLVNEQIEEMDSSRDKNITMTDIYVYSIVYFKELKLTYDDYKIIYPNTIANGKVTMVYGQNTSIIKLQLGIDSSNYVIPRIKNFIYLQSRPTEVDVTGLGSLNNLVPDISNWSLGIFCERIVPKLELEVIRSLRKASQNTVLSGINLSSDNKNS
ncbi:uncharacterized protein LOC123292746 [Chrysoperla carnea]|uniref:uncharacterized protein LOC123292746 n=1 Tax=Chrysoperla carnea TaxID=189513 RepID=UPI001D08B36C|nr:uncharacterized protein LOC123292746 [Chrysoperla carnea]